MKNLKFIKNLIKSFWSRIPVLDWNKPIFDWTIFLGLFTGIFFIFFIAWNRVIRDKLPRVIELEIFTIKFYIILYLFLNFLVLVIIYSYKLMLKIKNLRQKENKSNLWRFIHFNTPFILYIPVIDFLGRIGQRLCNIYYVEITGVPFLEKYTFDEKTLFKITLILLVYLPRLICFSVFCYEVTIKKELNYFYQIAIILLIPLIFFCLRRIFFDLSYYEIQWHEQYIKVISRGEITEDQPFGNNIVVEKKGDWISDEDFVQAQINFDRWRGIYLLPYDIYRESAKYGDIVNLIIYLLLMISFGVWLFQI